MSIFTTSLFDVVPVSFLYSLVIIVYKTLLSILIKALSLKKSLAGLLKFLILSKDSDMHRLSLNNIFRSIYTMICVQ